MSDAAATGTCPHCQAPIPSQGSGTCLSCGLSVKPEIGLDLAHPFQVYFGTLWEIMAHPARFFSKLPVTGGVAGPLAFALITHWMGSALAFLWKLAIGGAMAGYTRGILKIFGDVADVDHPGRGAAIAAAQERVMHWIWGAGSIIADPFLTLVSIAFTSFFVWIGARLLVEPKPERGLPVITYESALRVVCFGLTPSILVGIPVLGPVVSWVCVLLVSVVGAREIYRTDLGRAIGVALFPKLLWLVTLVGGLFVFALALLKLLSSAL